ncbi:MAG: hypothetical protein M1814_005774 [Vezdaea aestivalis]|nr:MAG: hypothetical protein M1814_005774 [Vezdaea aestivalis]
MSAGYYGTAAPQQQPASYGSVYYGSGTAGEITQAAVLENRKRGIDALNDFLADVKRRQFDPASYAEVGHRLLQLQSLGMPVQGVSDYQHPAPLLGSGAHQTSAAGAHHTGPVPQYQYSLPRLPDLRTKSDLVNIDQFLEQMQTTVYENSTQAAAAGYPQSGITLPHAGNGFRASNSPPQLHSSTTTSGAPAAPIMASTPSASGTPALTPPSSGMSSTSGYSPISLPSVHGASPDPQTMGGLYPSLPALSSAADMHSTFGASAAPSSGLGSAFDVDARRRFPGGRLQQSVQVKDKMDLVEEEEKDGASTPKPSSSESRKSPEGDDESYDDWIGNIRVIEGLRGMIAIALEHKEYDDENKDIAHEDEAKEVEISYPVIGSEAAI